MGFQRKAGHHKAGRSDFRNLIRTRCRENVENADGPSHPEQGSKEIPLGENAQKAEKTRKLRTRKRGNCGKCG